MGRDGCQEEIFHQNEEPFLNESGRDGKRPSTESPAEGRESPPKNPFWNEASRLTGRRLAPWRQAWPLMYWSIALAACLPAPMARMTVAAPVTASPPA